MYKLLIADNEQIVIPNIIFKAISPEKELPSEKYPMSKEQLMLEKSAIGKTEEMVQAFSHIFEWLQIEYYGSIKKIKAKLKYKKDIMDSILYSSKDGVSK